MSFFGDLMSGIDVVKNKIDGWEELSEKRRRDKQNHDLNIAKLNKDLNKKDYTKYYIGASVLVGGGLLLVLANR